MYPDLKQLNPLLQIDEERFRRWRIKHITAAFGRLHQNGGYLFTADFGRGRNGEHHPRHGIGQRPVNKLLGDKGLVWHDDLFAVPVGNRGRTRVDPRNTAGQVADRHGITNTNRLFEQDNQARDKVGKNLLQAKPQSHTQCSNQPLQFRPFNTNHRETNQPTNQQQQIFGQCGNGVTGTRRQIKMLQQCQLKQRGHIAHQLSGDDKHQNSNQHRTQGNWLNRLHALYRCTDIPQLNILQEAEGRVNF